jgi:hypothetical protein
MVGAHQPGIAGVVEGERHVSPRTDVRGLDVKSLLFDSTPQKLLFPRFKESFTIHPAQGSGRASPIDVHRMEAWQ